MQQADFYTECFRKLRTVLFVYQIPFKLHHVIHFQDYRGFSLLSFILEIKKTDTHRETFSLFAQQLSYIHLMSTTERQDLQQSLG